MHRQTGMPGRQRVRFWEGSGTTCSRPRNRKPPCTTARYRPRRRQGRRSTDASRTTQLTHNSSKRFHVQLAPESVQPHGICGCFHAGAGGRDAGGVGLGGQRYCGAQQATQQLEPVRAQPASSPSDPHLALAPMCPFFPVNYIPRPSSSPTRSSKLARAVSHPIRPSASR